MIKIALLHGAKINAGDFLIKQRTRELLEYFYPDSIINEYYRNCSLEEQVEEIDKNDIVIFAGGPGYTNEFYPVGVPFVSDLNSIKIPIMIIGMGWWGMSDIPNYVYNYAFNEPMIRLLNRSYSDVKALSCRDYISSAVLRNNGFDNVYMTGCPAWYFLPKVNETVYTGKRLDQIEKIYISDCANPVFYPQLIEIIGKIRALFPDSTVKLVFHRGVQNVTEQLKQFIDNNNIDFVNIEKSGEGLSVYEECDLHIGFRVHAHIYNLSKRRLSILIAEDSRGMGVNQALGLKNICATIPIVQKDTLSNALNVSLWYEIEDYIFDLLTHNNLQINRAFYTMNEQFKYMSSYIMKIKDII